MNPIPSSQRSQIRADIVIPVLNEAHVLEHSVNTLRQYLSREMPYRWRIVVADNGSTDGTNQVANRLAAKFSDVTVIHLSQRGRGRALRYAWTQSTADILCYMDVDLSTGLESLVPTLDALVEEGYDLAVGSRLMHGARIRRCLKRDVISRIYNLMIKAVLFTRFSDAQCGFKAVTRAVVEQVVPAVRDQAWFFDTELLVFAEKLGYRIKDIPVTWNEDTDSRVKIISTAWEDIKGVLRLRKLLWSEKFALSPSFAKLSGAKAPTSAALMAAPEAIRITASGYADSAKTALTELPAAQMRSKAAG